MKVVISPYSRKMRNGKPINPKDYPYFDVLISKLQELGHEVIQIGVKEEKQLVKDFRPNMSLDDVKKLILECDAWVSVDNFLPHMVHHLNKPGIVLFGRSDPNIYGYPENRNLLKDRKYLREKQFDIWEVIEYAADVFVSPKIVLEEVLKLKGEL